MSEEILKELVDSGKVTTKDIATARLKVDAELRACAFSLHAMLCNKEHVEEPTALIERTEKNCLWYVEQQILEDEWSGNDHKQWLHNALMMMEDQGITDTKTLLLLIREANTIISKIKILSVDHPNIFEFIKAVLKNTTEE